MGAFQLLRLSTSTSLEGFIVGKATRYSNWNVPSTVWSNLHVIFFQYLTKHLVKQGLTASAFDPCLFIGKNLIVVIYVDDILIYGRTAAEIDALIVDLQKDDISLNKEGTAEGYLGVDIGMEGGKVILRQEGLTKRIISVRISSHGYLEVVT